MVCPELTEQIRREITASLHQRKGDLACYFLTDLVTFTLPAGTTPTKSVCFTTQLVLRIISSIKLQMDFYSALSNVIQYWIENSLQC